MYTNYIENVRSSHNSLGLGITLACNTYSSTSQRVFPSSLQKLAFSLSPHVGEEHAALPRLAPASRSALHIPAPPSSHPANCNRLRLLGQKSRRDK